MKKLILGAIALAAMLGGCAAAKDTITNNIAKTANLSAFFAQSDTAGHDASEAFSDMYALITHDTVRFYEDNVAGKKIITNIRPKKLQMMQKTYNVKENKLYAILIVKNLAKMFGDELNIRDMAAMGDSELFSLAKRYGTMYYASLDDARRAELTEKFRKLVK